jgi:asparagine synthase (glutamine-hydrolysing)
MSAIAGIIDFDGAPVARADLERMSRALEPFGRDREFLTTLAGAGLVTRLSHITPEDRLERQPIGLSGQDCLLFAGRLDNRTELLERLGITPADGRLLADGTLAARAWERWGRDCLTRLIGVFSLAHWQPGERRLTLARAAPRGGPLYVHRQGGRVWFASAPHALFALPQIPRALNEAALGDLLLMNSGAGETLYQGIELVQNAHWAQYRPGGGEARRYWAPDPAHRLSFKREEDAWEALKPLFETVVQAQLRSIHPVGIQMSGGLDSAAIAGQAARILAETGRRLPGYTRVPAPGTQLRPDGMFYNDERPRVAAIAAMHPNLDPCFVDAGEEPVLDGLRTYFAGSYAPFLISPTFLSGYQMLYRRAAVDGVRVLLTGGSGNLSFSYDGHARLGQLLRSGRWLTLVRELLALHRFRRGNVRDLIQGQLLEPLALQLRQWGRCQGQPGPVLRNNYGVVAETFAQRSGALERMRVRHNTKARLQRLDSRGWRAALLTRTGLGGADELQAQHGLEMRQPGGDQRLVEFCLALPDVFYLKGGIERRLVRLGMAHLIPESIRLDPTRGRQDVDWALRMHQDTVAIGRSLNELSRHPAMGRYLDLEAMQTLWQRFEQVDWRDAPVSEVTRYRRGLMGGLVVGQFVHWFEGTN